MARSHVALLCVALSAGCGDEEAVAKRAMEAFEARRAEANLRRDLGNHAFAHAQAVFDAFEPRTEGPLLPPQIVADLTETARSSKDRMIAEAARKYSGFKYVVTFEDNDLAVPGASVVAAIDIFDRSGVRDPSCQKVFLTRSRRPWLRSPSGG